VPLDADLVPSRVVMVTSRHFADVLLLLSLAWTDLRRRCEPFAGLIES
jgi:hypothetical protein